MLEERKNERSIDLLDLQPGWFNAQPLCREADEQLDGVRVGFACVRTCSSIAGQMFAKEYAELRRERGHGAPRLYKDSLASAICRIKTGVASRYQ